MIKKDAAITNERLLYLVNNYSKERNLKEPKSKLEFARLLYDNFWELLGFKEKRNFNNRYNYASPENKNYRNDVDIVYKELCNDLKSKNCNNSKANYIIAYCKYFMCSADYLLGLIDLPTYADTDVNKETGLNVKSIQTLRDIQKTDENENTITVFPKNLYDKIINKEPMTQEEKIECEKIFFNPSEENIKPYPSNRPKLMDLLNFMLEQSYCMEKLLKAFRNFINPYTVPVFFDDENGWTFPDNQWSKDVGLHGNITYTINLASDEKKPDENFPIWIDKNFLDSIYIKSIDSVFQDFRNEYYEKNE